jgi:hypothetical protein
MAYTTLADLREYLGISNPSDTDDDDLLTQFIDDAQSFIENYCRRRFEVSADSTHYYDPNLDVINGMLLFDDDLITITSLTIDSTLIASTNYDLGPRNKSPKAWITLRSSGGVSWTYSTDSEDAIEVVGKWGYSETPPDNIVYVCKRLAAYYYRKKDAQVFEDTTFAQAGTITVPEGFPKDILKVLDGYRRRTIRGF